MIDWGVALRDGLLFSICYSIPLLGMFLYSPRLFLNPGDLPADVLEAAAPKTAREKRLSIILGMPALLVMLGGPVVSTYLVARGGQAGFWALSLHALVVILFGFFWDLLVLDFLLFCTITPPFMVVPGTEGLTGYKDKMFHVKAHTRALPFMFLVAPVVALAAMWLA